MFAVIILLAGYIVIQLEDSVLLNMKPIVCEDKNCAVALSESQIKVISLQENEKYITGQLRQTKLDLNGLQEIYSQLFSDASYCYWANACLYRPESCEYTFESPGKAMELHNFYSEQCNGMIRDWEKYQSFDIDFKE